jgi:hypothetical protein
LKFLPVSKKMDMIVATGVFGVVFGVVLFATTIILLTLIQFNPTQSSSSSGSASSSRSSFSGGLHGYLSKADGFGGTAQQIQAKSTVREGQLQGQDYETLVSKGGILPLGVDGEEFARI